MTPKEEELIRFLGLFTEEMTNSERVNYLSFKAHLDDEIFCPGYSIDILEKFYNKMLNKYSKETLGWIT